MYSNRPITFAADLNLHTFVENEIGPMTDWSSVDVRKYSKKQKISMNVSSSSVSSLTKHRNGHECSVDFSEDYSDSEWSWAIVDDIAMDVDDVDNGHGKFSNTIYPLKRLLFSRIVHCSCSYLISQPKTDRYMNITNIHPRSNDLLESVRRHFKWSPFVSFAQRHRYHLSSLCLVWTIRLFFRFTFVCFDANSVMWSRLNTKEIRTVNSKNLPSWTNPIMWWMPGINSKIFQATTTKTTKITERSKQSTRQPRKRDNSTDSCDKICRRCAQSVLPPSQCTAPNV